MFKKFIFVIVFAFSPFFFNFVEANVVINEIMYDLDGGDIDYFEVLNNGNTDVDLTEYKFIVNDDSVNGHGISLNSGSQNLKPGDFGVIVANSVISNYLDKWSDLGNIFTASFSLPNSIITTIILKDQSLSQIDKVDYDPSLKEAKGDGNSLQLVSNTWKAIVPTPGAQNFISVDSTSQPDGVSSSISPSGASLQVVVEPKNKIVEEPKIKTKIIAKTFGFVGLPVFFQAITLGRGGEELYNGKYFWNFGDADSKEVKSPINQILTHTYFYPGDYTISLFYYQNYYSNVPDATAQINIEIVPAEILISNVGNEQDFFIELSNNTVYEVDLSGWTLTSNQKIFNLPHGTILASGKKVLISPKISNFTFLDKDTLKLINSSYELVSSYTPLLTPVVGKSYSSPPSFRKVVQNVPSIEEETEILKTSPNVNLASAISSDIGEVAGRNNFYAITGFFIFIATSAYLVYFIRQKKVISQVGSDFDILDE